MPQGKDIFLDWFSNLRDRRAQLAITRRIGRMAEGNFGDHKPFGGVQAVAEKAEVNPTQLYRTLSAEGNPSLSTLTAVLKAVGLRLAIQPIKAA